MQYVSHFAIEPAGLFRQTRRAMGEIFYHAVPVDWRREQKYDFLERACSIAGVKWTLLNPDKRGNWMTEPTDEEFADFVSVANKAGKDRTRETVIFSECLPGVATKRDSVVFAFTDQYLKKQIQKFITAYNGEVRRYEEARRPKNVDDFVDYSNVKWSSTLKIHLTRCERASFTTAKIRKALYRPFTRQALYYDAVLVDRPSSYWSVFPSEHSTTENRVVCVNMTPERPFVALATNMLPESVCTAGFGSFSYALPLFTYSDDGKERRDNITSQAVTRFQNHFDDDSIKRADIFHYVYALLHHPAYRTRYAENLKRELPRIPLLAAGVVSPPLDGTANTGDERTAKEIKQDAEAFWAFAKAGKRLADLHVNYEEQPEFPLQRIENKEANLNWRVETMKLIGRRRGDESLTYKKKDQSLLTSSPTVDLFYNDWLSLAGIPAEVFAYRLGNRSALEWVIDQYRVTRNADGEIVSDPNRLDDEEYIVRLIGQVVHVSVETLKVIGKLPELKFP